MEDSTDRPKWLLELENRKRKPRLAHEAGAGAPCMNCGSACPGLDLHFWRKICKNCKCSRDDHDVEDDDFPQFELLFGKSPAKKFKRKPILLRVDDEKHHEGESAFEWVPPDTTKELAADYMKALPAEKLPIKGSAGAALRRQLLQKQLPLHDIDHKVCDELSDQEKKQFEKYLESIKKYVGQGKVTKITNLSARPFDRALMTPINATDMQRFSPRHKSSVIPGSVVQLRTPSSFATKTPYTKNLAEFQTKQETLLDPKTSINPFGETLPMSEKYDLLGRISNSETANSEPTNSGIYGKSIELGHSLSAADQLQQGDKRNALPTTIEHSKSPDPLSIINNNTNTEMNPASMTVPVQQCLDREYKKTVKNPSSSLAHSEEIDDHIRIAESILADALLPPSRVNANDIIGSTLDEKKLMYIREKLTDKYTLPESQTIQNARGISRNFDTNDPFRAGKDNDSASWRSNIPPTVNEDSDRNSIISAMRNPSALSNIKDSSDKPMKVETEVVRSNLEFARSIPLDSICMTSVCELKKSSPLKNNTPIGLHGTISQPPTRIPENCNVLPQVPVISNISGNSNASTHDYKDTVLSAPTLDPVSRSNSQLPASHANILQAKLSSSSVPSSIIHSKDLHNQIFPHEAIGRYNQETQNLPNVEHLRGIMEELTVESAKPQKCHKCQEDIRVGDVVVITEKAKNASWHPGCFVCDACDELLVDLVYFHYKNKLYCGRDLATLLGIPRCFACDELIFVREYTVAEGHNYHVKHFCCWDCDVPLAGQQYITENDRPLCLPCYQKTYAKTCKACMKVIAADQQGVAVKNLDFHAKDECFSCHTCKKSLLNSRMAVKEEKLFCSKECISKFLSLEK